MKDFNWESFKENRIAVHCDTEEKAKDFLKECDKRGINWSNGISLKSEMNYEEFKNKTCYSHNPTRLIEGLLYGEIDFFEEQYYDIVKWEIEENIGGRKMKLLELLEAGKKATNDGMNMDGDTGYLVLEGEKIVYFLNGESLGETALIFKDFTSTDWYEYKEEPKYKTNFDMKEIELYHYNTIFNKTASKVNIGDAFDESILKNFNVFKDKKLAECIQAKQLLERKLMIFSYLNGAEEIDWEDGNKEKYYLEYYYDYCKEQICIKVSEFYTVAWSTSVYFKSKEIAKNALELYRSEIEKVVEMGKKFRF